MLLAMAVAFVGCKKSDSKDEPSQGTTSDDPSVAPVLTGIDGVWFGEDGDALYISKKNNLVAYLNTYDLDNKKQFVGEYTSEDDSEMSVTLARPQHADETVAVSVKKDGEKLVVELDGEEKTLEKFAYKDYKDFFGTWVREYQISYNADGTEKENGRIAIDAYTMCNITYMASENPLVAIILLLAYGTSYVWDMTLNNGGEADMYGLTEKENRHYVWLYDGGLYLFNLNKNDQGIRNESSFWYYNMQKDGKNKMAFVDVSNDGSYSKATLVHPMTVAQAEKLFAGKTYTGTVGEGTLYGKDHGAEDAEAVFNTNHTGTLKVGSNKLDFKWSITQENPRGEIAIECDDESTDLGKINIAAVSLEGDKMMFGMAHYNGDTESTGTWLLAPLDEKK